MRTCTSVLEKMYLKKPASRENWRGGSVGQSVGCEDEVVPIGSRGVPTMVALVLVGTPCRVGEACCSAA